MVAPGRGCKQMCVCLRVLPRARGDRPLSLTVSDAVRLAIDNPTNPSEQVPALTSPVITILLDVSVGDGSRQVALELTGKRRTMLVEMMWDEALLPDESRG